MPAPGGLHAHVLDTLGQRIVDGTLAPGTVLRPDDVVAEWVDQWIAEAELLESESALREVEIDDERATSS